MPLAAAATIGAVVIGIMQTTPQEQMGLAPHEPIVTDSPRPGAQKPASPQPAPAAAAPATSAASSAADAIKELDAAPEMKRDDEAAQKKKQAAAVTMPVPAPPPSTAPAQESRRSASPARPVESEVATASGKLDAARAPEPFPAAPRGAAATDQASPPRKAEATEMARAAPGGGLVAQAPAVAADARKDAAGERQQLAAGAAPALATSAPIPTAPAPAPSAPAPDRARAPASAAGFAPAPSAAPAPARAAATTSSAAEVERSAALQPFAEAVPATPAPAPAMRSNESSSTSAAPAPPPAVLRAREAKTMRDETSAGAAGVTGALAKNATPEELRAKARDPDAWIAAIRKLRDDGNTAQALRELHDFRSVVPDAERRLPADLRDWAAAAKP
jgi:hypothetical protein